MEAYYHSDQRIQEWIDQIIEKNFTTCLLNGTDSEAEFQKGCNLVTKLTTLLKDISAFPAEYLEDGLKQLLQQRLPDSRVVSNFPSFQNIMEAMIKEGVAKVIDFRNEEQINLGLVADQTKEIADRHNNKLLVTAEEWTTGETKETRETEGTKEILETVKIEEIEKAEKIEKIGKIEKSIETVDTKIIEESETGNIEDAEVEIPVFAQMNAAPKTIREITMEVSQPIPLSEKVLNRENPNTMAAMKDEMNIEAEHIKQLERVLKNLFLLESITYYPNYMGQKFIAQAENVLICLEEPKNETILDSLMKEGFKIFRCSSEDLSYPRRVERGLRQIKRSGKKYLSL